MSSDIFVLLVLCRELGGHFVALRFCCVREVYHYLIAEQGIDLFQRFAFGLYFKSMTVYRPLA